MPPWRAFNTINKFLIRTSRKCFLIKLDIMSINSKLPDIISRLLSHPIHIIMGPKPTPRGPKLMLSYRFSIAKRIISLEIGTYLDYYNDINRLTRMEKRGGGWWRGGGGGR